MAQMLLAAMHGMMACFRGMHAAVERRNGATHTTRGTSLKNTIRMAPG